jgi:hypothetical protein
MKLDTLVPHMALMSNHLLGADEVHGDVIATTDYHTCYY